VLVKPRLIQADSGAYPRGGRLTLEAWLSLSLSNMNRMARLSTDHCWKKESFNYGQSLPKEEHLCHFHVRASLVSFEVLILAFVLRTNINISKDTEKDTSLV
jgi:hypothetical protein